MWGEKLKYNKRKMIYSVASTSAQHYCEREGTKISSGGVIGFLPFSKSVKRAKFELEYNLSYYTSLKDFLLTTMLTRHMFVAIIKDIVDNIFSVETHRFNKEQLELRINYVMLNQATFRINFIYVPIQPYKAEGTLKELLNDIIKISSFDSREDTSYVPEFIQIINEGSSPSLYSLKEFCIKYSNAQSQQDTVVSSKDDKIKSNGDSLGEYSVNEDSNGNVTIFRENIKKPDKVAYLIAKGATPVLIDKLVFRIGKLESGNEYRINNNLVSRKHAILTYENGSYYVTDLNSKNGTCLNDKRIVPNQRIKLTGGDKIAFANQSFAFRIED